MNPDVSVIIPLYNKELKIARTIESVLMQTFHNIEIIIVDDGSTDNSATIIQQFRDDRIYYHHQANQGVSSARNQGVKFSRANWILFLDADDILFPSCLETLIQLRLKCNCIPSANYLVSDEESAKPYLFCNREMIISDNFFAFLTRNLFVRAGNTLLPREFCLSNPFRTDLSRNEDHELFFKLYRTERIAVSPVIVMSYDRFDVGLSKPSAISQRDYIFCLDFEGKTLWEKAVLTILYRSGLSDYPLEKKVLRGKYGLLIHYLFLVKLINLYNRVKGSLCRGMGENVSFVDTPNGFNSYLEN